MELHNPNFIYPILGTVFAGLLMVSFLVYTAVKKLHRRRKIIQTIKNSRDAWGAPTPQQRTNGHGIFNGILRMFAGIGSKFSDNGLSSYSVLRLRLLRAGIRHQNAAKVFWGAKLFLPLLLILVFFGLRMFFPPLKLLPAQAMFAVLIILGVLGFYLPECWLHILAHVRKSIILKDLPDALDLLVVCVEAGLGLDSAFNKVAEEMKMTSPQLSDEFKMLNLELRAGKGRQDALRNLSSRTDIDGLKSLVTLLIQTDKFGTSITKALRVFSNAFRTKRFQKAEEIAAKLPVKMMIPVVFCIFPTLMAVMIGPACISLWENFLNR